MCRIGTIIQAILLIVFICSNSVYAENQKQPKNLLAENLVIKGAQNKQIKFFHIPSPDDVVGNLGISSYVNIQSDWVSQLWVGISEDGFLLVESHHGPENFQVKRHADDSVSLFSGKYKKYVRVSDERPYFLQLGVGRLIPFAILNDKYKFHLEEIPNDPRPGVLIRSVYSGCLVDVESYRYGDEGEWSIEYGWFERGGSIEGKLTASETPEHGNINCHDAFNDTTFYTFTMYSTEMSKEISVSAELFADISDRDYIVKIKNISDESISDVTYDIYNSFRKLNGGYTGWQYPRICRVMNLAPGETYRCPSFPVRDITAPYLIKRQDNDIVVIKGDHFEELL